MRIATYPSKTTNATYRIVADEMTVSSLVGSVATGCSSYIATNSSKSPEPYDPSASSPKPVSSSLLRPLVIIYLR